MKKLKKLLKLQKITSPEEQKDCWLFDKILYNQISKLVRAKNSLDYHINCLKSDYREKAMVLCGQLDQETGKPYMRAYQHLIQSEQSWEKQRKMQDNQYFQALLFKQKRLDSKWERLAKECKILHDLYIRSDPKFLAEWT